jgi:aryl-alcohol dehydrogenase-like predicted oxidoreductase
VPYAESIGAFKELQDEGKVRWVGISNASVAQIEEALGIVDVVSVQNQLSLEFTHPLEAGEVKFCEEHGIAFLPWSPLGGISSAGDAAGRHDPVRDAAEAHGVSPQRVALAWLLSLSDVVIPIPGASRPGTIRDSLGAVDLELSGDELHAIGGLAAHA